MMMNDFYTCHDVTQGDNEYNARVVFNPDHDILKGHFPGQPVVPGVCMMELVKDVLQTQVNMPMMLSKADNVKFLQLIVPGIEPSLKMTWKEDNGVYTVNALLKTDAAQHFKCVARYVKSEFAG